MSKARWFVALLAVFALVTLPTRSASAAISIVAPKTWGSGRELTPEKINQADCLNDAELPFSVNVDAASLDSRIEVWAGTGCETRATRDEMVSCWKVVSGTTSKTQTVTVRVQDIAGENHGSVSTCAGAVAGGAPQTRQLYFFIINSSSEPEATATWSFKYDLTPPDAPTDLSAGPGEEGLILSFESSDDSTNNVRGYDFYCAPAEGDVDAACDSALLIPGEAPDQTLECGSSTTISEKGRADGLTNGVRYAVGASTVDTYYNASVLSNVACGVPAPVTGFFEAYRRAGGQGGGSYCSFSLPTSRTSSGFAWAVAALAVGLVFRRRRP